MNSTQIKLNLKTFLPLLLVVLFISETIFSDQAFSKMASMAPAPPLKPFPAVNVINYYNKKQKTQKLTQTEADILKLTLLAQDVFEIKDFNLAQHLTTEKEKVESLTLINISMYIQQGIQNRPNWHAPLSSANLEKLKDSSELIKKTLTETSSSWAWVCFQIGQQAEAKKILTAKFENSYTAVMKMTAVYNHGTSPLKDSEDLAKHLKPMSTDDEIKSRDEQIKKMRTHISALPDMQIMT